MAKKPSRNYATKNNSKVLKQLAHRKKAKPGVAYAGVRSGATYPSGITVASVLYVLEHGARINHPGGTAYKMGPDGPIWIRNDNPQAGSLPRTKPHLIIIPPRPALRYTAETRVRVWQKVFANAQRKNLSVEQSLAITGMQMEGDIKNTIASATGLFEDNAASTIKKKGFNAPLRGKGGKTLVRSITSEVRKEPSDINIRAGGK